MRHLETRLFRIDQDEIADSLGVSRDSSGNNLLHFLAMFNQFSTILAVLKYCPKYEVFSLLFSTNNKAKSVLEFLKESHIPRDYSDELLKLIEDPMDLQLLEMELGVF